MVDMALVRRRAAEIVAEREKAKQKVGRKVGKQVYIPSDKTNEAVSRLVELAVPRWTLRNMERLCKILHDRNPEKYGYVDISHGKRMTSCRRVSSRTEAAILEVLRIVEAMTPNEAWELYDK
jgi:hypothetical protein